MSERDEQQQAGVDEFDRAYFKRFGRFPSDSPLGGILEDVSYGPEYAEQRRRLAERRRKIEALAERGATEGERAAARAALGREHKAQPPSVDKERQAAVDWLAGIANSEMDDMRRGGNHI